MSSQQLVRTGKTSSRWARFVDAVRSLTISPLNSKDPALARMFSDGPASSTGIAVTEYSALNYSPVWAAVAVISGDVAHLPLVLYRRTGTGKERYDGHPLYRLLHDQPNPECTSMTFRRTLQAYALTWGNGYAEIERNGAGKPVALWPIEPSRVAVFRTPSGKLRYRVYNQNAGETVLQPSDMLHIRGLGTDIEGYSVIARARESVSLGIAAERFGGTFFGNGSTFGGVLKHPGRLSPEARDNLRKSLEGRHQGVDRAHKFVILEENMEYKTLGIPPDDAQFLETRQFQIADIARWFSVPPHKIGDLSRATFSNIEQQNIEYYQTTIVHWLETWEQELMTKLIAPSERNLQVIEHVTDAMLRGDSAGRAALESTQFAIGAITPNESRALDNRNPISGGDRSFVPLNMIPLDRVDAWVDAQIAEKKAKANPPVPSGGSDMAAEGERAVGRVLDHLTKIAGDAESRDVAIRQAIDALNQEIAAVLEETRGRVEDARTEVATVRADLAAVRRQWDTDRAERDATLLETLRELEAARVDMSRAVHTIASLEADVQDRTRQRDDAVAARTELTQQADTLRGIAAAAATDKAVSDAEASAARELALQADIRAQTAGEAAQGAAVALQEAQAARDATGQTVAALQGRIDTLQAAVAAAETARAEHAEAVLRVAADLTAARVEAEQAREETQLAEARTREAEHAAREQLEAERGASQLRVAEIEAAHRTETERRRMLTLASHRALVVDAMGRSVRWEADKARKHQATPAKLKAWADTFYVTHEETCIKSLLPAVRAHLAWVGSDADPVALTEAYVRQHIAESLRQLNAVVAVDDPEEFHPTLERLLQRWESERPAALADRLLKGVE